jgi:hypothetical protein
MRGNWLNILLLLPIGLQAQNNHGASVNVGVAYRSVPNINKVLEAVMPGESVGFNDHFFGIQGSLNIYAEQNCFSLLGTLTAERQRTKNDRNFQPYLGSLLLEYGIIVTESKKIMVYPSLGGGLAYSILSSSPKKGAQADQVKIYSRLSSVAEFAVNIYAPLENHDDGDAFTGSLLGLRVALQMYPNYGNWATHHGDAVQTAIPGAPGKNLTGFTISLIYGAAYLP